MILPVQPDVPPQVRRHFRELRKMHLLLAGLVIGAFLETVGLLALSEHFGWPRYLQRDAEPSLSSGMTMFGLLAGCFVFTWKVVAQPIGSWLLRRSRTSDRLPER